jgi:hypothetical protein
MTYRKAVERYSKGYTHDFIEIGSTPMEEKCTQAGIDSEADQLLECRAFINQILRTAPPPPGAGLFILRNEHEFGPYHEVAIGFELPEDETQDNPESYKYAYSLECMFDTWDREAREELTRNGHKFFKIHKMKVA